MPTKLGRRRFLSTLASAWLLSANRHSQGSRVADCFVFPLHWESPRDPKQVARLGNFHAIAVTPKESWITVGEEFPTNDWRGDTLLARVRWRTPNAAIARS